MMACERKAARERARRGLTIQDCHAAGMSMKQAAAAMGVSYHCAYQRARRAGLIFRKDYSANAERMRQRHQDPEFAKAHAERVAERMRQRHQDPEFAKANAERMRQRHQDPEFAKAHAERVAERMRQRHQDPEFNPLAALTHEQRADYDVLKRAKYSRAEALAAIGVNP
jgi:transposase